jgi:hypothetical protein
MKILSHWAYFNKCEMGQIDTDRRKILKWILEITLYRSSWPWDLRCWCSWTPTTTTSWSIIAFSVYVEALQWNSYKKNILNNISELILNCNRTKFLIHDSWRRKHMTSRWIDWFRWCDFVKTKLNRCVPWELEISWRFEQLLHIQGCNLNDESQWRGLHMY